MKGWPSRRDPGGEVRIEIPTSAGRSQVVVVASGTDGDGDPVGFIWSKAGEVGQQDPWALLRMNAELTYGKVCVRGRDIVVVHGLYDPAATLSDVGKTLYFTARAADELERTMSGADNL